jgi:TolA-binding protein/TM2 domain-containing membrane protein YozV
MMEARLTGTALLTLVIWLLLTIVVSPARSEPRTLIITDELQLGLAESFLTEGEYYRAITEYKRFLYFFPDSEQVAYVQLQIGMAYYRGGEYPAAIEAFAKVRQDYPAEHYAAAAFYEGVCRSRLHEPAAAQDNFDRVLAFDPANPLAAEALAGIALNALDRQDLAGSRRALERLAKDYPHTPQGDAAREAMPIVLAAETEPCKSPVAAGVFSALVPGSGQLYAGRYRDGLLAFLVNGLFIAGTAVAIDQDNDPAAVLLGAAGLPFYLGNIYGAANAAHKWNLSIAQDLRSDLAVRLDFRY